MKEKFSNVLLGGLFSVPIFVTADATLAFGRDDNWTSGWGQGVSEAVVTLGPGNQIYVTCNEGGGDIGSSSVSFMLNGKEPSGNTVFLTFDNEDPESIWISDGYITSDCRACAGNFEHVLNKLRSHSSVHVMFPNGDAARFTLKGSNRAIGKCTPDFYK